MDMKEEMMSDAVDDAMEGEDEGEGEEMEGDKILKEVFDEIGMSMNDSVSCRPKESIPCKDADSVCGASWKSELCVGRKSWLSSQNPTKHGC